MSVYIVNHKVLRKREILRNRDTIWYSCKTSKTVIMPLRLECVMFVKYILLVYLLQRCEEDGGGGKSLVYSWHWGEFSTVSPAVVGCTMRFNQSIFSYNYIQ